MCCFFRLWNCDFFYACYFPGLNFIFVFIMGMNIFSSWVVKDFLKSYRNVIVIDIQCTILLQLKLLIQRGGMVQWVACLNSISHEFEPHQRLLLFPWARNFTLIAFSGTNSNVILQPYLNKSRLSGRLTFLSYKLPSKMTSTPNTLKWTFLKIVWFCF